jgi:hypothetical protein
MSKKFGGTHEALFGVDTLIKRTFIPLISERGKIIGKGSEKTDPHLIADYLENLGLEEMTASFEIGFR